MIDDINQFDKMNNNASWATELYVCKNSIQFVSWACQGIKEYCEYCTTDKHNTFDS